MKAVIKIGGFLFGEKFDGNQIKAYAQMFRDICRQGHEIVIVAGGGETARKYIEAARAQGENEAQCDQIGIYATRLNARLLISALGKDAFPEVPATVEELRRYFLTGKTVVMGGLQPAHSTDAVAAVVAETINADVFVKTTDAPGVCTKDPRKYPDAKKLDEISIQELYHMISERPLAAGAYELMDPVAVRVIARSKILTWIVSGDDPVNVKRALKGDRVGTKVIP